MRSKVNRPISVSCSKISDRRSIQFLCTQGNIVLKLEKKKKVLYFLPGKGWFLYQNVCKRIEGYSLYMLRDRKQVIRK